MIEYYDNNNKFYFNETVKLPIHSQLIQFLDKLPEKSNVLDLGCGSGRDSLFMIKRGFNVTSLDGSEGMAELASEYIENEVLVMDYLEMNWEDKFDGIWANAGLVHCTDSYLEEVLPKIIKALKTKGLFYCSFKVNEKETIDERGRYYNNWVASRLLLFISNFSELQLVHLQQSQGFRKGEKWVNMITEKT